MLFFKKNEFLIILSILLFLFLTTYINILFSFKRERDIDRRDHLSAVEEALIKFNKNYNTYPPSENGMIKACVVDESGNDSSLSIANLSHLENPYQELENKARGCFWGKDSLLSDLENSSSPKLLDVIPNDPLSESGRNYYYISDGNNYQLFADMETNTLEETGKNIETLGVDCGLDLCDYRISNIPIEK